MPAKALFSELWMWIATAAALGLMAGAGVAFWGIRLTPFDPPRPASDRWTRILTPLATALAFAFFVGCVTRLNMHLLDDVRPDAVGWHLRVAYHLALIALLVASTVTDLRDYVIPDEITSVGSLFGVVAAFVVGELQIMHLWVDWSEAVPGISGAWTPAWIDHSRHWHGVAVSMAGLVTGGGLTWMVRALSTWILGREALGFGDVTLMGMIGSFLGWQPVIFVFLLAPVCGLVLALLTSLISRRSFVPYGPYLAASAYVVLCFWKPIWNLEIAFSPTNRFSLRQFFGDATGLAILAGAATASFVLLLLLLRGYRAIPIDDRRKTAGQDKPASDAGPPQQGGIIGGDSA